jgi:hypothetical protein
VAGWLAPESERTLRDALAGKEGPIRLDISGLRFAEQSALGTLRLLEGNGAKIEGASPYIERLLRSAAPQECGVSGEAGRIWPPQVGHEGARWRVPAG